MTNTPAQNAAAEVSAVEAANVADLVVITALMSAQATAWNGIIAALQAALPNLSDGANIAGLQAVIAALQGVSNQFLTLHSTITAATTAPPTV